MPKYAEAEILAMKALSDWGSAHLKGEKSLPTLQLQDSRWIRDGFEMCSLDKISQNGNTADRRSLLPTIYRTRAAASIF